MGGAVGGVTASASAIAQAALTSPMWLNACGKFPRSSPLTGSTCSDRSPTSFTAAAAAANVRRAWSDRPASACACASQNVHSRNVPSSPSQAVGATVPVDQPPLVGEAGGDGVDRRLHPGVVGGDEADDRHHQARGVELVGPERLGERADVVVPAAGHDRIGDLVAGDLPSVDPVERVEAVGQRDRTIERDPAHQLRVEEVAGLAPDLPDALVGSCQRAAAMSARSARKRRVTGPRRSSWSGSRWAASRSSPYTSSWRWFKAPLPTRTGVLAASRTGA